MGKTTRLANIYSNMKNRCYNKRDQKYKNWGGRGITVCDEWMNQETIKGVRHGITKGWTAFKKWAESNGYADNLTLDRIDNNKGYSPENCRWVPMKEQANNTRRNIYITYKGKTQTVTQWSEELNISRGLVYNRIKILHWSVKRALEEKPKVFRKYLTT